MPCSSALRARIARATAGGDVFLRGTYWFQTQGAPTRMVTSHVRKSQGPGEQHACVLNYCGVPLGYTLGATPVVSPFESMRSCFLLIFLIFLTLLMT